MKLKALLTIGLSVLIIIIPKPVNAELLAPSASSAILIDGNNGRVLYEQNAHERRAPASTTKIMTTYIALGMGILEEKVVVSTNAAKVGGSSMYLSPSEILKLEHLLYGVMLNSGNDASTAVAEHIAGSTEAFSVLMTERAKQIGANNSQFKNPHGLDAEGHYTTAYDLAIITKHAMENPIFREIVSSKTKTVPWNDRDYDKVLRNKNKLLSDFPGANGTKTGFTSKAGRCLVSSAERNGQFVIAVVMNCSNMWEDSKRLLQYGFDNFESYRLIRENQYVKTIPVVGGIKENLRVIAKNDLIISLTEEEMSKITPPVIQMTNELSAPISAGQPVGYAKFFYEGKEIGKVPLIAEESIEVKSISYSLSNTMFTWLINLVKIFG